MFSGVLVALLGTAYSAYTDWKTGYVNDFLTHSMIILGAILVLISNPLNSVLWIYATAAAVFGVGFLMYIFGQVGGGDVKLFTALALLIPNYPKEAMSGITNAVGIIPSIPPYPFVVSLFVLFSIFYIIGTAVKYVWKIKSVKNKIPDFRKKAYIGLAYVAVFLFLVGMWFPFSKIVSLIFIPIAFSMFLMPFKEDMVRIFFAQKKKISKLDNDDVIALELLDEKTKKALGLRRKTYTDGELKRIKALAQRAKISTITVCENMPRAVPYIFAALAISLIFGDVMLWAMLNVVF